MFRKCVEFYVNLKHFLFIFQQFYTSVTLTISIQNKTGVNDIDLMYYQFYHQ